jgi:uncharacterized membrane protein
LPTPQPSPSPAQGGIVFGFVNDEEDNALRGVTVTITGNAFSESTETNEYGYYEFNGLSEGDYTLEYEKEGYVTQSNDVTLGDSEVKDLGTMIMEQVINGKIYGYVVDIRGNPVESVKLSLKGLKTKVSKGTASDADGFFEFTDLEADTYIIFAKRKGYKKNKLKIRLEEGESKETEIVMKKTSKRVRGLWMMEDGK